MIDTHCHLTFPQFEHRVGEVLTAAREVGVRGVITISTTSANAVDSLRLAREHDHVWCSAGVHPLHSDEPADWNVIYEVAQDHRCVAWGELGLDHHYDHPPRALQLKVLEAQLTHIGEWAGDGVARPIVVHCRESFDALLPIFRASGLPADRFVFHCFTGTTSDARAVLDFGAWISFTGVVTFRNAPEVAQAAQLVPADRIMVETDAPFLSPEPVRTVRPNEPKHVVHIARYIAELRGEAYEDFERQLDRNAERFFGITLP